MASHHGIVTLLAPNPSPYTGPGTNTYLVTSRATPCVVIDPGPEIEAHMQTVATAASHGRLRALIVTHDHPDHGAGAARLRALTGAPILTSERATSSYANATLADGDTLEVGERRLRVLYTPGHRYDHLCLLLEDDRTLFAGDVVAGAGTVLIAPPEGDMAAYLRTLHRLLALDLARILPGHGAPIEHPHELLRQYIAHRGEREEQIWRALVAGPKTVTALVARIYPDLDPAVREAAGLTMLAHLLKLEGEGRVARDGAGVPEAVWRALS